MNRDSGWPRLVTLLNTTNPATALYVHYSGLVRDAYCFSPDDPIHGLHPTVQHLTKTFWHQLTQRGAGSHLRMPPVHGAYAETVSALESRRLLVREPGDAGLVLDPGFAVYICSCYARPGDLTAAQRCIEQTERGRWIAVGEVEEVVSLPGSVIQALFHMYEAAGLGSLSTHEGVVKFRRATTASEA